MKVGLIGYSQSGRSALYRACAKGQAKGSVTAVPVPDERFDKIVDQVKPKKVTPATVILDDDHEPISGGQGKAFSTRLLDSARKMDVLLHVVRAFESNIAPYHAEVNPTRDQQLVDEELLLADLQIIENRLEKLAKSLNARQPGHQDYLEKAFFERIQPILEEGTPLRAVEFTEDEQGIVRNFQFLSAKQMVVAFNVAEDEAAQPSQAIQDRMAHLKTQGTESFAVCATIEEEIAQLDPADQPEFLSSLGLTEPASTRLIQAIYRALGLITFFTAGESETRAWPLRSGSNALKAAGTIHTDIAKGFIRSETVSYADYCEFGSLDAAYAAGKMRLEGKEYVVQDGDLLHIRNKS
ncbi:MAG: redox-regulated ATPase YchF [Armatimonadetes bacterium]|nr:redox-regulated ATPase YchF [Armatimonadota bacterium]